MKKDLPENIAPRKHKMTWKARQSKNAREVRRRKRRAAEREAILLGEAAERVVTYIAEKNGFDL